MSPLESSAYTVLPLFLPNQRVPCKKPSPGNAAIAITPASRATHIRPPISLHPYRAHGRPGKAVQVRRLRPRLGSPWISLGVRLRARSPVLRLTVPQEPE